MGALVVPFKCAVPQGVCVGCRYLSSLVFALHDWIQRLDIGLTHSVVRGFRQVLEQVRGGRGALQWNRQDCQRHEKKSKARAGQLVRTPDARTKARWAPPAETDDRAATSMERIEN